MTFTPKATSLARLPDSPGVYFFYKASGELLYVGKATSLKHRVRSYFSESRGSRPIEQFASDIARIEITQTDSVLEAMIAEANAISSHCPKYNVLGRDNRSWNYFLVTKEDYPRIIATRAHELGQYGKLDIEQHRFVRKPLKDMYDYVFGPFPGMNTKATLKLLRSMFLFSTCQKVSRRGKQACFYRQIHMCLGVCTGEISKAEYRRYVIAPLVAFLKGGKKKVIQTLIRRMKKASCDQKFEEASRLRNQIASLERIHDIALLNKSFFDHGIGKRHIPSIIDRIEAYDISNLGKSQKVGSMVVFDMDGPAKKNYRRFKIKTVEGQSDVDCLAEVLSRRLKHPEWKQPDIILVDGGKPQVARAKKVLEAKGFSIPVLGIAKGPVRKKNEFILGTKDSVVVRWIYAHTKLLIHARDEAHRFAISYQKKLARKNLIRESKKGT
jgi:excinuclease UvrABC nuclease subunit